LRTHGLREQLLTHIAGHLSSAFGVVCLWGWPLLCVRFNNLLKNPFIFGIILGLEKISKIVYLYIYFFVFPDVNILLSS
jgi:hypothetical protein